MRLEPLKRASKEPAPPPAAPARAEYSSRAERPDHAGRSDPDLSALDASLDGPGTASAADAERAAQIERLEIWLAKLEQEREGLRDDQE